MSGGWLGDQLTRPGEAALEELDCATGLLVWSAVGEIVDNGVLVGEKETAGLVVALATGKLAARRLIGLFMVVVGMLRGLGRKVTLLRMIQLVGQAEFSLSITYRENYPGLAGTTGPDIINVSNVTITEADHDGSLH